MKLLATTALLAACSFTGGAKEGIDATIASDSEDGSLDAPASDGDAPDASEQCFNFIAVPPLQSSYYFSPTGHAWLAAEEDCEAKGAHLAILDDAVEAMALAPIAGGDSWVGITDFQVEGTWLDVAGRTPPYLVWKSSEPSTGGNDDAAFVKRTGADLGTLDAGNHTTARFYICECDDLVVDPTSYEEDQP